MVVKIPIASCETPELKIEGKDLRENNPWVIEGRKF